MSTIVAQLRLAFIPRVSVVRGCVCAAFQTVITADVVHFQTEEQFYMVYSIELFEHYLKNYQDASYATLCNIRENSHMSHLHDVPQTQSES